MLSRLFKIKNKRDLEYTKSSKLKLKFVYLGFEKIKKYKISNIFISWFHNDHRLEFHTDLTL